MGVAWVLETKESLKSIEVAVEQSGAVLNGHYRVDCTLYRPPSNVGTQLSSFYLLHHSNFPESSFIIAGEKTEGKSHPSRATSDQGFDLILGKLAAGLVPEQNTSFVLQGSEYHLKDFRIRIGTAAMVTSTKGFLVELEYAPSVVVVQSLPMLTEFVETFFPGQGSKKPECLVRSHEAYTPIETLSQYLDYFKEFRKRP
jgi:hypothetical protein